MSLARRIHTYVHVAAVRWARVGREPAPRSWWMTLFILCMVVMAAMGFLVVGYIRQGAQNTQGESTSCAIQSRGLRAGRHLTKVVYDLSVVLHTLPPPPPNATPEQEAARNALIDLRANAASYAAIEKKQPKSRHC